MKISFNTVVGNLNLNNGYGIAGYNMVLSLQKLGHQVPFADPTAPVEIAFCQPDYSSWSNDDAYHIQYTPWESNELPDGWVDAFNDNCDEVWTPSPLVAQWYKEAGVVKPIFVYEHGIDHMWDQKRRRRGDKLRFLHVGEPAPRKGGQMAMEAFRDAFGDRDDVHLTIKAWNHSNVRVYDKRTHKSIQGLPHEMYNNVTTVYNDMSEDEMVNLFRRHDALIYPGWGEGFGLIPLQALATGMPTICTEAWAPYNRFLLPELSVSSTLVDSPWPSVHTGKMFKPDFDDVVKAIRAVDDNYDRLAGRAYRNSFDVHREYDWVELTKNSFDRIVKKFSD
jgi:glycosyltransferase involved in cell wall biosynthesis